jgi:hypothetical protein
MKKFLKFFLVASFSTTIRRPLRRTLVPGNQYSAKRHFVTGDPSMNEKLWKKAGWANYSRFYAFAMASNCKVRKLFAVSTIRKCEGSRDDN